MSHARLTQDQMFDWIERCIDGATPLPSDDEIMDRFILPNVESARTLLAALSDAGRITIRGWGPTRRITLGKQRAAAAPAPRPIRSAKKPALSDDAQIEAGLARIAAAVARGKAAVGPVVKTPPKSIPVAKVAPAPIEPPAPADTGQAGAGAQREVFAAPAAPHPVMAVLEQIPPEVVAELSRKGPRAVAAETPPKLAIKRLATRGTPRSVVEPSRQVTFCISQKVFDRVAAEAASKGVAPGRRVKELFEIGMERPRIPAKVATAAMRAGVPVLTFAAMLMERGLAGWLVEQDRECAA